MPDTSAARAAEGGSVYRCAECGHGRHLMAWAGANVYGPLAADGELEFHDAVEEWGIHEDSIECTKHPGAPVEQLIDGQWCRWWSCAECGGSGRIGKGSYGAPGGYPCPKYGGGGLFGMRADHEGWRPVAEIQQAAVQEIAKLRKGTANG